MSPAGRAAVAREVHLSVFAPRKRLLVAFYVIYLNLIQDLASWFRGSGVAPECHKPWLRALVTSPGQSTPLLAPLLCPFLPFLQSHRGFAAAAAAAEEVKVCGPGVGTSLCQAWSPGMPVAAGPAEKLRPKSSLGRPSSLSMLLVERTCGSMEGALRSLLSSLFAGCCRSLSQSSAQLASMHLLLTWQL